MVHVRKQIRDAVKTALTTRVAGSSAYPTVAQDRVYIRGSQPVQGGQVPYIKIKTISEDAERLDMDNDRNRTISLELECAINERGGVCEDDLDALCVQVETIIDAGIEGAFDFEYTGTEFNYPQEGSEEFGLATISYDVTVITQAGDPETSQKN